MFDEDIAACYDMSLKDFEHSGVYDLFKVHNFILSSSLSLLASLIQPLFLSIFLLAMSKFVAAFRQDDYKGWAKMAAKATDEAKEMQNLIEELKADII